MNDKTLTMISAYLPIRATELCPVCGTKITKGQLGIRISQASYRTTYGAYRPRYVGLHRDCLQGLADLAQNVSVDGIEVMGRMRNSPPVMDLLSYPAP